MESETKTHAFARRLFLELTIPLKEAASLLRNFLLLSFAALTLLSPNVLSQIS